MPSCGGIFDFDAKERRLAEVVKLAEDPAVWNDPKRAQDLGRERKTLESLVGTMAKLAALSQEYGGWKYRAVGLLYSLPLDVLVVIGLLRSAPGGGPRARRRFRSR